MPASTPPPWSIPYPLGTDRVADGDNAMQSIAERVAAIVGPHLKQSDAFVETPIAAVGGYTGGIYMTFRSGWVSVTFDQTGHPNGQYPINSQFGSLPAGYAPLVPRYFFAFNTGSGAPVPLFVHTNGALMTATPGPAVPIAWMGTVVYPIG